MSKKELNSGRILIISSSLSVSKEKKKSDFDLCINCSHRRYGKIRVESKFMLNMLFLSSH
jgi:hypothetical protein